MPFDGGERGQIWLDLEALWAARARIAQPGGWCQGLWQFDRATCALSALVGPVGGLPSGDNAWAPAERYLVPALPWWWRRKARHRAGWPLGVVAEWNDQPRRTQADVVALYDRAIRRAARYARRSADDRRHPCP